MYRNTHLYTNIHKMYIIQFSIVLQCNHLFFLSSSTTQGAAVLTFLVYSWRCQNKFCFVSMSICANDKNVTYFQFNCSNRLFRPHQPALRNCVRVLQPLHMSRHGKFSSQFFLATSSHNSLRGIHSIHILRSHLLLREAHQPIPKAFYSFPDNIYRHTCYHLSNNQC